MNFIQEKIAYAVNLVKIIDNLGQICLCKVDMIQGEIDALALVLDMLIYVLE